MDEFKVYESLLFNAPLHWPSAKLWMWNYCIYLGPWENEGSKYDLGIYISKDGEVSAACVFGEEAGDYYSGDLKSFARDGGRGVYHETVKRATACGLYKQEEK